MVLATLGSVVNHLNYYNNTIPTLSREDQFLVALMKLRVHHPNEELALLFGISRKQVSNIFITWINLMFCQWKEICWWPARKLVKLFCPRDIFAKFPNSRINIDGTEFPVEKPTQPILQQATFSTYKNRNTMKALVGASPGELFTYVSPAYGGLTSHRQIVERSGLNALLDFGDKIMADKGFNVEDLMLPYRVTLNIPFLKKKNRMSGATVRHDRKVSSKRVHIERLISLAKTSQDIDCANE